MDINSHLHPSYLVKTFRKVTVEFKSVIIIVFRYADQVSTGDEVLIENSNILVPVNDHKYFKPHDER